MSYADGWAAINLEMPARVPRTEYSVERHWALIRAVTGLEVDEHSSEEVREQAGSALVKAWDYGCMWCVLIGRKELGDCVTKMGHAEFAAGGTDRSDEITCPYSRPEEVLAFDPWERLGPRDRKEMVVNFEAQYQANCRRWPDCVNMTGIYVTCISGLIELFGWEMMLLAAGTDSTAFGDLANRYASWVLQYFEALAEADVPVVMVHDDIVWTSGPFLAPDWYRTYVFPNYKKFLRPLLDSGKRVLFTSDGTYSLFVDDIAACGVHGFVMEPTTDMAAIAEKYGNTHVIIGNADTRILLLGTKEDIRSEVERCMAIGKEYPGFFLAVGNHIPANTPVENALYYNEVYEKLSRR